MMFASFAFVSCQNSASADSTDAAPEKVQTIESPDASAVVTSEPTGPTTVASFKELEYDFGSVDQGEKVTHTYTFKNDGKEPLIISNAKGSCGCTVPQWPKEPIAPGEEGEILVQFDTKGKKGNQTKTVTLTANTEPAQTYLKIKGIVNAPDAPVEGK